MPSVMTTFGIFILNVCKNISFARQFQRLLPLTPSLDGEIVFNSFKINQL